MVDFVEVNGARLAYRMIGHDDAPLMITLHGGRGFGGFGCMHEAQHSSLTPQ
jgi:hypothetical protein